MASFDFGLADERRQNAADNEDFLIEDLSEFAIESNYGSPLQQNSDIKSDCTTATTYASSSASDLLQHSELVAKTAFLGNETQESPICLPDQDDTGFDWLGSLGDDNLIYMSAPNLDMDSFLLSTAMPFSGTFDGMLKHTDYESAILSEQDVEMRQTFMRATCGVTPECRQADNERCSRIDCHRAGLQTCNATDSAAPTVMTSKSARSKRTRSVSGWSSGGFLCERGPENPSPTHSLQSSTSQASNEFAKCASQCQGCINGFMCSQEEGYTTNSHDINMDIKFDANLIDKSNGVISEKLGSSETYLNKEDFARGEAVSNSYGCGTLQPRRCTHCLSHKTPQWRAGPMGPKTLCNACGVRFKSGRLFEEYRPAKSPTFLSCKHSSSHKKVMEMRRRKAFHYNQHQRSQHMPLQHRVRASPMMQTDANNQAMIGNFKVKLDTPAPRARVEVACSTIFSDVTLIRTRNALESPSKCL